MAIEEFPAAAVKEKFEPPSGVTFWTVVATFAASVIGVMATFYTQMLVGQSQHAMEFEKAFSENRQSITAYMSSFKRPDEQAADMSLTVLYDFADTTEDRIAMLTIAARMLNATDCPSNGEATARFLGVAVRRIKHDAAVEARNPFGSHENGRLLEFVRSQPFLDLASDDVPLSYFNDDGNDPIVCGSSVNPDKAKVRPVALPRLFTPSAGDPRNHSTFWGERAAWNEAKNGLFTELRPDDAVGWIHVATWETQDACVDASGARWRIVRHMGATAKTVPVACTPIRLHYTSNRFTFKIQDSDGDTNGRSPFWLGRARFLRNAPPRIYAHYDDNNLMYRGALGHVIGVVNYGECVNPVAGPLYFPVATANGLRHFVHAWLKVRVVAANVCFPNE